jgi:hypothetical protein
VEELGGSRDEARRVKVPMQPAGVRGCELQECCFQRCLLLIISEQHHHRMHPHSAAAAAAFVFNRIMLLCWPRIASQSHESPIASSLCISLRPSNSLSSRRQTQIFMCVQAQLTEFGVFTFLVNFLSDTQSESPVNTPTNTREQSHNAPMHRAQKC